MHLKKIVFCFVFLSSIICSKAQDTKTRLAELMKAYHAYNMFDGAVLVAENGKIIYKDAFGLANREWNIPNSTDTKFMIGSISKPLTATLVLLQVQKGLLRLDQSLDHYLPEFVNKPAAKVTIRQLLNHTSGIPNYDIIKDFFPRISRQHYSRQDYLRVFIDSALAFTPGTKYVYSSWGYFTLGYLLEKVSGKSYAQLIQEDIFKELGMDGSGSYFHTQVLPKRATGYDYSIGGYTSGDFRDQSNTMGTGDIYSTVEDLFKFHMALSDNRLLNEVLRKEMFTPGIPPADYGFGWFNKWFKYSKEDSVASNLHLGMTDGFISFIRRIPSTRTMVVILCNSSPTDFFNISNNVLKIVYKQPVVLKEPVHKRMETLIGSSGAANAVAAFQKMHADTARYYSDWISMNFIAEQLLNKKRYEDAKLISENNVKTFPDKDLILVTMGNIYLALGEKQKAITSYKRALEITPMYEEAKNRLKELEAK